MITYDILIKDEKDQENHSLPYHSLLEHDKNNNYLTYILYSKYQHKTTEIQCHLSGYKDDHYTP